MTPRDSFKVGLKEELQAAVESLKVQQAFFMSDLFST
jgi:hypothetical protein